MPIKVGISIEEQPDGTVDMDIITGTKALTDIEDAFYNWMLKVLKKSLSLFPDRAMKLVKFLEDLDDQ